MPKSEQLPVPGLLRSSEVATRAKVDVTTVNRWARSGRLPVAYKVPGTKGTNLYRPEDVDDLIEKIRADFEARIPERTTA